jgi:hypothetical protein
MSDLTTIEKVTFERLLNMETGYVLDFSNWSFEAFVIENTGREIFKPEYDYGSGSKANRLRAFWNIEENSIVGKLMGNFIDYGIAKGLITAGAPLTQDCQRIVARLFQCASVPDLNSLSTIVDTPDFEKVLKAVQESIDKNQPEIGLDRLHTFVIKYFRFICEQCDIEVNREKPLHSLLGEYVKYLRNNNLIESEMTERILKSNISVFEAFNHVRNNHSLAHDNPVLNYDESLLIFNHVTSSIRFIETLEAHIQASGLRQKVTQQAD